VRPATTPPIRNGEVLTYVDHVAGVATVWATPGASPHASPFASEITDTATYTYRSSGHDYNLGWSNARVTSNTIFGYAHASRGRLLQSTIYVTSFDNATSGASTDLYPANRLDAVLPLRAGASWSGTAADNSTYVGNVERTGTTLQRDGSYSLLGYHVSGDAYFNTVTLNADGRGKRSGQYTGRSASYSTVGVPVRNGSAWVIPGTRRGSDSTPASPPPDVAFQAADWYPGGGALSSLYTDRTTVTGAATTPAGCGAQSGVATIATVENYRRIDPILAYDASFQETSYYSRTGYAVCQIVALVLTQYDLPTSKPMRQTKETDRLILTSATGAPQADTLTMPIHRVDAARTIAATLKEEFAY